MDKAQMRLQLLQYKVVASGLCTIALVGAGIGVGIVFGAYVQAMGRNPFAKNDLTQPVLLGFALTEAVGLLGLCMSFLLLFLE